MSSNIISQIIYENRRRLGMSQKDLGNRVGVSNRAVSKWENGSSEPSTSNLIAIAKLYEIAPEELLKKLI